MRHRHKLRFGCVGGRAELSSERSQVLCGATGFPPKRKAMATATATATLHVIDIL